MYVVTCEVTIDYTSHSLRKPPLNMSALQCIFFVNWESVHSDSKADTHMVQLQELSCT